MDHTRRAFMKTTGLLGAGSLSSFPRFFGMGDEKKYPYHGRTEPGETLPALREKTGLKLKAVESYTQGGTLSVVRVVAENGAEGWGQISTYDADLSAMILHRKVARHARGKDPADLDEIVDRCIESNHKYPWSYVCRALSGLDTAIWDLLGKIRGKSVCELLGGKPRSFPVYGSSMSRTIKPKDEASRLVRLRDERGYKAFKVRVGRVNGHDRDAWPGRSEEIIPTVRKALGGKIALLADANSCYTPPKAIELGGLMEEHGYVQFEEPCPYWELEWTAEVAKALKMEVSGGEQDNDLAQWRRMIETRSVDIVQPDILYVGGITRAMRVAAMAAKAGLTCVPHSANRAWVTVFSLHMMGAIPNAGNYVEFSIEKGPWSDGFYQPALKVEDGKVAIPDGPGWGVTVKPEWLEKAKKETTSLGTGR